MGLKFIDSSQPYTDFEVKPKTLSLYCQRDVLTSKGRVNFCIKGIPRPTKD